MKITLINLAIHEQLAGEKKPIFPIPPHAIHTVASLIEPNRDFEVEIIDENFTKIDFSTLQTDVVGFSITSRLIDRPYQISDFLRKRGIKVIMGGIHATVLPEEVLEHCDAIVSGEAEDCIDQLLDDLKGGTLKRIYKNQCPPDLANRPHLNFSLLNIDNYYLQTISTTRGCPYHCDFCSVHLINGNKVRTRPLDEVLKEIDLIKRKRILFSDDDIIANKKYAATLFKALIGKKKKWTAQCSINIGRDQELLKLAKASGCEHLFIGIESINENNLADAGKKQNKVSDYKEIIANIHKHRINIQGGFVFGFDHDNYDTFKSISNFISETKIDALNLNILSPYPGTKLREKLNKQQRLLPDHHWKNLQEGRIAFKPRQIEPAAFEEAYRVFYKEMFSLKNIFKRVVHAPNKMTALMSNMSSRNRFHAYKT